MTDSDRQPWGFTRSSRSGCPYPSWPGSSRCHDNRGRDARVALILAGGEEQSREWVTHASGRRTAGAWATRCVARQACERATPPRYRLDGVFTTRTGQIEYPRDLHPDAVGHLAIVIGDVPLVPERRPLVDLGDQPVRVHLHLVPHASLAPSSASSSSRQLAPPPRLGKLAAVASGGPTRTKYGRILAPG